MLRLLALSTCLAWVIGCSDSNPVKEEPTPASDAGTDATSPESWLVHVEVTGKPGPGVPVLTSFPDGSIHAQTQTDSEGKVDVQVPHLGSVSVFVTANDAQGKPALSQMSTFGKVDASTTLRLPGLEAWYGLKLGVLTFVPTGVLPAEVDHLRVSLPCGGSAQNEGDPTLPIVFENASICDEATEYFAVVWAMNAANVPISATVLEDLPATAGDATYPFELTALQPFTSFEPALTPLGPEVTEISARLDTQPKAGKLGEGPSDTLTLHPPFPEKPISLPVLENYFELLSVGVSVSFPDTADGLYQRQSSRYVLAPTLPENFALDPYFLAPIESVSPVDVQDITRPSLSFSISPTGALGSCVGATIWWGGNRSGIWTVRQKVEQSGVFRLPNLPEQLAEFAPAAEAQMSSSTGVFHSSTNGECSDLVSPQDVLSTWASPSPAPPP